MVAVAIPVVSLGLPILDVAFSVLRRFLSYKRLFAPDREHIHHKLLGRGISHRQTVLVLYSVSACFCLFSLLLLNPGGVSLAAVLVVVGIGVLIGVQQLKYHEFLELGRVAGRTLNQRHAIANGISVRRTAESLETCTSLPQFCQILRECLEPIGFDGFGVYLSTRLPVEADLGPFKMVSRSKVQYFWDRLPEPCDANWSLTFGLTKRNGKSLGGFTLYRKNTASQLWMDLDAFTMTGFSKAVAACVEKMQNAWPAQSEEEKSQRPIYEPTGTSVRSGFRQSIPVRSSG
jgi:hypothetical protein